ncbi:hypothetical protein [Bifidobacterium fermentum]
MADAYQSRRGPRFEGSIVTFFPSTSLRTRVAFERGLAMMGLQPSCFRRRHSTGPRIPQMSSAFFNRGCAL